MMIVRTKIEILNEEVEKINFEWDRIMFQTMMMKDKEFKKEALRHYNKSIPRSIFKA
jgi:hypothetical protein